MGGELDHLDISTLSQALASRTGSALMILNWIDQQAALDDLLAIISEARAIALDTEFVRVSTFHPKRV